MATSRLTRIAFGGLVALVALAPLPLGGNRPWAWSALSLAVGFLLIVWALAVLRDGRALGAPWPRVRWLALGFALLVAWIAFQALPIAPEAWRNPLWAGAEATLGETPAAAISIDPQATFTALMRLLAYGGVFWLAAQLGRSPARARAALWTVALAGFAYALYRLTIEFGGFERILWYRRWAYPGSLTSTFVNRNSFATYAGIALVTVVGLLLEALRRAPPLTSGAGLRWLLLGLGGRFGFLSLMALAIGSALLMTNSRGGLVASLAGLFALALAFAIRRGARPGPALATLAAVGVIAVALLVVSGGGALDRLGRTVLGEGERPAVYALVLGGIADRPWLGTGYGTFEEAFPVIRDETIVGNLIYDKAHNSYLEFAFEAGLPAFALMMALLAGIVWRLLGGVWGRRRDRLFPCVGVGASALVATHALVDFSIQIPAVAITYALILGVAFAQSWSSREECSPHSPGFSRGNQGESASSTRARA